MVGWADAVVDDAEHLESVMTRIAEGARRSKQKRWAFAARMREAGLYPLWDEVDSGIGEGALG